MATPAKSAPNNVLIAAGLTVLSALCFAGLSAQVKYLTGDMHGFVVTFWRNFWGLFFILPWIIKQGLADLTIARFKLFFLRSVLSLISMLCGFTSFAYLTFAKAISLGYASPLFATMLAALLLHETVRIRRWSATAVGFIGVLVVLRPGLAGFGIGEFLALAGAFSSAIVIIVVKQLATKEAPNAIVAYMVLLLTPLSLIAALPFWSWPSASDWPFVVGMGLCGTIGHLCWTRAMAIADASLVVPFDYSRLVFAVIIGVLLFGERPDEFTLLGAGIIVLSGIYIARREALMNQQTAQAAVTAAADPSRPSAAETKPQL
jgi:drug/metabolite transporter (DMT)-like permease